MVVFGFSKKLISRFLKNIPCLFFCIFLVLGQFFSFFFLQENIIISTIIIFFILIFIITLKKTSLFCFFLIGIFSFFIFSKNLDFKNYGNDKSFLIELSSSFQTPKTNEVSFEAHVLGILKNNKKAYPDLNFKKLNFFALCRSPYLPWLNISKLKNNDTLIAKAKFKNVNFTLNPFSYDAYLLRKGISKTCYIKEVAILNAKHHTPIYTKIRNNIKKNVISVLGDNESSGLFLSMSIGARNLLSRNTEDSFKRTGLTHLLVVSGYQVCVIYFSVLFLLNQIPRIFSRLYYFLFFQRIFKIVSLFFSVFFVLLSGSDSSSVRAGIAIIILCIVNIFERNKSFANTILLSFFILHLASPLSLLDPGVALSYAALFGIWLGSNVKNKFLSLILISFYTYITTSIITLLWFKQISIISFFLNITLAPFISIISCNGAFLAILAYYLGDKTGIMIKLISFFLDNFKKLVIYISNFDFIYFSFNKIPIILISVLVSFILFLFLKKLKYYKNYWGL